MKKFIILIAFVLASVIGYGQAPSATCSTAPALTINGACGTGTISSTVSTAAAPSCIAPNAFNREGWYSFTVVGGPLNVTITGIGNNRNILLQLFSGPCGGLVEIGCANTTTVNGTQTEVINNPALANGTYFVRVLNVGSNGNLTLTSLCITSSGGAPANDLCANATTLPCGTVNMAGTTVGTVAEGSSPGGCASLYGVWYTFVGNGCSNTISSTSGVGFDHEIDIFSGSCGTLTNIACIDGALSAGTETYTFTPTNGVTYYVYVAYYGVSGTSANTGTFTISRSCLVPCAGTPNAGTSSTTPNSVTCGNTAVVLNAAGITTDCGMSYQWQVNTGSGWNNIVGGTTIPYTVYPNVNTQYRLISTCTNSGLSNTSSTSSVTILNSSPVNDDPCNAITLPVNAGFCANQTYSTTCASASEVFQPGIPAPGCASYSGGDIWFKVTVPASGRIIIDTDVSGITDGGMAIYTSSTNNCNNVNTLVECDDDDSNNGMMPMIARTGTLCTVPCCAAQNATLTPGSTVYVRFWEYGNDIMGTFNICAYEPTTPQPAITCANATVIAGLPYAGNSLTTCCAGNEYTSANVCASSYMNGEDYIFAYTPSVNISVDITTSGTSSATGLFISDKCPSAGGANCVGMSTGTNPTLCGINLTAGTTYYITVDTWPSPTCTNFNIIMTQSSAPTCGLNYTQTSPAWAWDDISATGTNVGIAADDVFASAYTNFGFTFCYDGINYNRCLISSNGYVIFDPVGCATNLPTTNAAPNGYSPWDITANAPNTNNMPRNSIMFPWADIDPSVGVTPDIKYATIGVSPNRRFIVSFNNVPMFGSSCTAYSFTGQIALFETSNNIEIRIANYQNCSGWNEGGGIVGLSNFNGTNALIAPNHNYTPVWNATNYMRRFTFNCATCVTLPVTMNDFYTTCSGGQRVVNWSTASEQNAAVFVLQSSTDGMFWDDVATVPASGNSSSTKNYTYTDNTNYSANTIYYQLLQIDNDGNQHPYGLYSSTCDLTTTDIVITPNPVNEGEPLFVYSNKPVNIRAIDILGREARFQFIDNKIIGLSAGIYLITVDNRQKFKIIVK